MSDALARSKITPGRGPARGRRSSQRIVNARCGQTNQWSRVDVSYPSARAPATQILVDCEPLKVSGSVRASLRSAARSIGAAAYMAVYESGTCPGRNGCQLLLTSSRSQSALCEVHQVLSFVESLRGRSFSLIWSPRSRLEFQLAWPARFMHWLIAPQPTRCV